MLNELLKPLLEAEYERGVKHGEEKQKLVNQEDQNRRLHEMFKYGKETGEVKGNVDGYALGHEVGYSEGWKDCLAKYGIVEISAEEFDALTDDMAAV